MSEEFRNSFQFSSEHFSALPSELKDGDPDECINPDRWARRLSDFLCEQLPKHGWDVGEVFVEDWGHHIELKTELPVDVMVGCGNVGDESYLVFGMPNTPTVRKWLKKIDVSDVAIKLGDDLERIFETSELCHNVKRDVSANLPV